MGRLKDVRLKNKKSQKDVAKYLGISQQGYALYEKWDNDHSNGREPKLETWKKLADYFDVSISWLQGVSDVRSPLSMVDILNESEKTDTDYIIDTDIVDKNIPAWNLDKTLEEYIGIVSIVKKSKHISRQTKENIESYEDKIDKANDLTSAVSHLVEIYFKGISGDESAENIFKTTANQMSDYIISELLKENEN